MATYSIYYMAENEMSISLPQGLDGITQGVGTHLVGHTITFDATASLSRVDIRDNDVRFQDNDNSQRLDGAQTIDGVAYGDNTRIEAEYRIIVSDGTKTYTLIGMNVENSQPGYAKIEGLGCIGGPGGFPPKGVPLTVISAHEGPNYLASSYATPICFDRGTWIETDQGARRVEDLRAGDLVVTADHGLQPLRWVYGRRAFGMGQFAPVLIRAGALGNPVDLRVSQLHKIAMRGAMVEYLLGEDEVFVEARALINGKDIRLVEGEQVQYFHLLFDRHEVIYSNGIPSESFYPGDVALAALDEAGRRALFARFPDLRAGPAAYSEMARRVVRGYEARVLLAA